MKPSSLLLTLGLICAAPAAVTQAAEEEDHSAHHPPAGQPEEAAPPAEHDHGAAKSDPLQENMQRIEASMKQIQQAEEPDRKRALLGEHLRALLDQMKRLRSQGASMKTAMKPPEKKDGDMMKGGGMMKMHKKMEQRVDMLERLLQQTLEREAIEEALDSR